MSPIRNNFSIFWDIKNYLKFNKKNFCPFSHGRARYFSLFGQRKVSKRKPSPTRAYSLIFPQRVEHPRDTLSLRDHAKIGIPDDFDADVA